MPTLQQQQNKSIRPVDKSMKYIFFTYDHVGTSIARKLIEEGNTVILAVIQDASELKNDKKEDADKKKERLALFDGMIQKHDAKKVLKMMTKIKNKDEWFVIFDFNCLWRYSEAVLKMGFTQGFFPLKKDFDFEEDRDAGKKMVKENYPTLKVAEVHEFKSVEEGISFLESDTSGNIYVLKSYDGDGSTVVPMSEDPELAKEELRGALELEQKDYEKKGYILEQKIINPLEITPQAVFYNGELVCTNVDIENKPLGAGSVGCMTGCAGNLIIKTELKDKINKIAFPKVVYDRAKEHKGLFVWDASILIDQKDGSLYFGEFCANRWGYDAMFAELMMCDSVSSYFESIVKGKNPYIKTFGVGVRMFNLKKHKDVPIIFKKDEEGVFMYDCLIKEDKIVSTGTEWDLLSVNGADDNPDKAVEKCYNTLDGVSFTNGYYRPKFDFVSLEYQNSILNRFNYANHKFFDVSDFKARDTKSIYRDIVKQMEGMDKEYGDSLSTMGESHKAELEKMKTQYQSKYDSDITELRKELTDILQNE